VKPEDVEDNSEKLRDPIRSELPFNSQLKKEQFSGQSRMQNIFVQFEKC
jgi:hypothetical protein